MNLPLTEEVTRRAQRAKVEKSQITLGFQGFPIKSRVFLML